jgi:hypothetical protein
MLITPPDEARRIAANVATPNATGSRSSRTTAAGQRAGSVRNEPGCCNKKLMKRYIVLHVTFTIARSGLTNS